MNRNIWLSKFQASRAHHVCHLDSSIRNARNKETNSKILFLRQGSKSTESIDPLTSSNILDSLLYLTSDVGIKWLA